MRKCLEADEEHFEHLLQYFDDVEHVVSSNGNRYLFFMCIPSARNGLKSLKSVESGVIIFVAEFDLSSLSNRNIYFCMLYMIIILKI